MSFVDLNRQLLFVLLCTKLQITAWLQKSVKGVEAVFSLYQFKTLLQNFRSCFVLSVWGYVYDLHFIFGTAVLSTAVLSTAVLSTAVDPRLVDLNGADKWSD